MVMKLHGWIDLIKGGGWVGGAVHRILTLAYLIFELLHFIFILEFCAKHISKTILAMVMKLYGWIDQGRVQHK